jgi:hypothetical protein
MAMILTGSLKFFSNSFNLVPDTPDVPVTNLRNILIGIPPLQQVKDEIRIIGDILQFIRKTVPYTIKI